MFSTKVFDCISSGLMILQRLPRRTGHDLCLLTVGSRLRETQKCSRNLCLLYFSSYYFYSSFCLFFFLLSFVSFSFYYFSLFRFVPFFLLITLILLFICFTLSSSSFLLVFFLATCTWFLCLLLLFFYFLVIGVGLAQRPPLLHLLRYAGRRSCPALIFDHMISSDLFHGFKKLY